MKFKINGYTLEDQTLLELNEFIHGNNEMIAYHMSHIKLVRRYAMLLNRRLDAQLSNQKLSYVALAHDLLKERSLDPSKEGEIIWKDHVIPQDIKKYVRSHLDVLEEFGLDEYFNPIQYHAAAAGIFLYLEFNIKDPEILYPVFFHSCQIIPVYETLSPRIKNMVDIIMLSDKLSSNWLRINMREVDVRIDLDMAVFGESGKELNYTIGLYFARLIAQGKCNDPQGVAASNYYFRRLASMNPAFSKYNSIKKIGGVGRWPKRNSQAFRR